VSDAVGAFSEDERLHLTMIQSVVSRMSTASSSAKGWGLTVAVAAFGFSAGTVKPLLAVLGLVVVVFFAVLDAYYLRQERLFRRLYGDSCERKVEIFSMDTSRYRSQVPAGAVVWSWSVFGFYGPLALVGMAALVWVGSR
jgi:hypothetical protein